MTDVTRLFDFPYYQLKHKPNANALVTKYNGKWTPMSTEEYVDKANTVSRALLRMGVQKNDKIAVIGMACRFPGASNIDEYWKNLLEGKDTIKHFTDEEILSQIDAA